MTPPRQDTLGERLSGVEATLEAFEKYERDRWHKLAQDMQPLVNLPSQMTRDMAKIQGAFEGRISTVTKEIERSITAAVERAIEPVNNEVASMKSRIEALETKGHRQEGALGVVLAILKSPAFGWLVGAALTVWALLTGKVQA